MKEIIFNFSDKVIQKRIQLVNLLRILTPFIIALFLTLSPRTAYYSIKIKTLSILFSIIIVETLLFILPRILFKKLKQLKIVITDCFIEYNDGRLKQKVNYGDIRKVFITKNSKGEIVSIRILYSENKVKTLCNVENMTYLFEKIKQNLPDFSDINIENIKFSIGSSPIILTLLIIITSLFIIYIDIFGDIKFVYLFSYIVLILMGLFLVIFKPISKYSGERFRKFEYISGYILSSFSFLLLLYKILK